MEKSLPAICEAIRHYAKDFEVPAPPMPQASKHTSILTDTIKCWAELCAPKPLVILFDEVDTLEGPAMILEAKEILIQACGVAYWEARSSSI